MSRTSREFGLLRREGHVIRLSRGVYIIGRDASLCDIVFGSRYVSKMHCVLVVELDQVHVRDLGSFNGVLVNNCRIQESVIRPQDELCLGQLRLCLVELSAEDLKSPAIEPRKPALELDQGLLLNTEIGQEFVDAVVVEFLDPDECGTNVWTSSGAESRGIDPKSSVARSQSAQSSFPMPHKTQFTPQPKPLQGSRPQPVRLKADVERTFDPSPIEPEVSESPVPIPRNAKFSLDRRFIAVVAGLMLTVVFMQIFTVSEVRNQAIHARLVELYSLARQNHQREKSTELLPSRDLDEIQSLIKHLQHVASAKQPIAQSLLRAARDGLMKAAKTAKEAKNEREWRLSMCESELKLAGQRLSGEVITENYNDPRFPTRGSNAGGK